VAEGVTGVDFEGADFVVSVTFGMSKPYGLSSPDEDCAHTPETSGNEAKANAKINRRNVKPCFRSIYKLREFKTHVQSPRTSIML
jgi:hypothetical protein